MADYQSGEVMAPVVTPMKSNGTPDTERFLAHCQWLLDRGVALAPFGTNSEFASLAYQEKVDLLNALVYAGVEASHLLPGTGCCALPGTVALSRLATSMGCKGVLVLPPFFYRNVGEDGIIAFYTSLIEQVDDPRLKIYLYNIPTFTGVPITPSIVDTLQRRHPNAIAGYKDSGGDWTFTQSLLERFAGTGLKIFSGSERYLLPLLERGGAGCISATANVNPRCLSWLAANPDDAAAERLNTEALQLRSVFEKQPLIGALKAAIAHYRHDPDWETLRPPLLPLSSQQRGELLAELDASSFDFDQSPESLMGEKSHTSRP